MMLIVFSNIKIQKDKTVIRFNRCGMPIGSTEIKNPILKRIAEGDISILNDINENGANITECIPYHGPFNPLTIAVQHGHTAIVKSLLAKNDDGSYEFPGVIKNIAAYDNHALRWAACNGLTAIVKRLLAKNCDGSYEFEDVIKNIAAGGNFALLTAAKNGHTAIVKSLLAKNDDGSYEFESVIENIAIADNYALRYSANNGHFEISYILAKTQWPKGACQMPKELHCLLPSIQKGARIVDGRNDILQVLRCMQQGTSRLSIYSPTYSVGKNIPFDIVKKIADFAGIYGNFKLVKDYFGSVVEDNTTSLELKYRELAMKRRKL